MTCRQLEQIWRLTARWEENHKKSSRDWYSVQTIATTVIGTTAILEVIQKLNAGRRPQEFIARKQMDW